MQNANIKYKIRVASGEEIELAIDLSDFEKDWGIKDSLRELGHDFSGWDSDNFTVIERNIELFNED